jgi:phosphoglycerol transferase MdoB-like AlkP superfamily enzyme
MHAYRSSFWNRAIFEKALGFKLQFYEDKFLAKDHIGWGLSDRGFFSQSMEKIKTLPPPLHVFLTTLTTHTPFNDVTAEIDNFPLGNIEGTMIGHYVRSMHYVDSAIGEFLHSISRYNLASNSIIAIYGDHRARFTENDLRLIGINDMNEIRKIPLIINIPSRKLGHKIETIGGLINFAPTISNILGIDISDKFFMGKNLMSRGEGFVIFRDGSYISENNSLDRTHAQKQLMISDLFLEKDLIPILTKENLTLKKQISN